MSSVQGYIVGWRVKSDGTNVSAVRSALDAAQLPASEAGELNAKQAWGRAIKSLKQDRLIDKVIDEKGVMSFQFTKKAMSGDRIEFDYEWTVFLDTNNGRIECPDNPAFVPTASNLLSEAFVHRNAADLSRIIQRLFDKHADLIPIIPDKGVCYFVPDQHLGFLEKIETFLQCVGGQLHRFPVPRGDARATQEVSDAIFAEMERRIGELNQAIEEMTNSTRSDTRQHAFEKYQRLVLSFEGHSIRISEGHERLQQMLESVKEKYVEKVVGIEIAQEEAKRSKKATVS